MAIHKYFSKRRAFAILVLVALLMTYADAMAQAPQFRFPIAEDTGKILLGIANFIGRLGIPVVTFFFILSGFLFVTAQGNAEKLKKARLVFIWTLVGTAIIVGAQPIAKMVINLAEKF